LNILLKYILIAILFATPLLSQSPVGNITSIEVSEQKDTLIIKRQHGNWWFGAFGGYNYNVYYGDLNISRDLFSENNPFYTAIDFNGGFGSGFHFGGIAEWLPPGENLGYLLKISFLDIRDNDTENIFTNDTFNTVYSHQNSLNYLTISPSVRYNFLFEGLHLFGGLDIEINYNSEAYNQKEFYNPEFIEEKSIINFKDINTRVGLHAGLGYDIFMIDYNNRSRIRFSPYVSLHYGTTVISDNNSNWNTLLTRIGVAVKIGPDNFITDTIPFDPTYSPPPRYLASAADERGIEFPEYRFAEALPAAEIAYVKIEEDEDIAEVTEEIPEEEINKAFSPDNTEQEVIAVNVPEQKEVTENIATSRQRVFRYPTSASTDITPEIQNYLDNIVSLYNQNQNVEIRVVGHSDNAGTLIQNTERSNVRAEKIKQYLMSRGLPEGAVLSTGVGSIDPVGPINTAEGRAQNRRVEITVVQ
jgi:outer membrane protein OmpA-like peptidoglycan-associated protein